MNIAEVADINTIFCRFLWMSMQTPQLRARGSPSLPIVAWDLPGRLFPQTVIVDQKQAVYLAQRPGTYSGSRGRLGAVTGSDTRSALIEAKAVKGTANDLALDGPSVSEMCSHMRTVRIHCPGTARLCAKQYQFLILLLRFFMISNFSKMFFQM